MLFWNITTNSVTVTGATPGTTYSFMIQARNVIGYSGYSQPFTIQAAVVPTAPTNVLTTFTVNAVVISWESPSTNSV